MFLRGPAQYLPQLGAFALIVSSLTFAPGAAFAQTPATTGASATPGSTVPPASAPSRTPLAAPAETPAATSIEITRQDDGKTFTVPVGTRVTVRLGADFDWTVSYDPPGILVAVPGVGALVRGVQGLLTARQPGTVYVLGEGKPHCDPGQSCAQVLLSFLATVVVQPAVGTGGPTATAVPLATASPTPLATPLAGATPSPATPGLPVTGTGVRPGDGSGSTGAIVAAIMAVVLGGVALLTTGARRRRGAPPR